MWKGRKPMVFDGLDYQPKDVLFEFTSRHIRPVGKDPLDFLTRLVADGYSLFCKESPKLIGVFSKEVTELPECMRLDYNLLAQKG
jgi:hypothetical protein